MTIPKEERAELRAHSNNALGIPGVTGWQRKMARVTIQALDALDQAERRIAELEAIIEETEREEARDNGQFGVGA